MNIVTFCGRFRQTNALEHGALIYSIDLFFIFWLLVFISVAISKSSIAFHAQYNVVMRDQTQYIHKNAHTCRICSGIVCTKSGNKSRWALIKHQMRRIDWIFENSYFVLYLAIELEKCIFATINSTYFHSYFAAADCPISQNCIRERLSYMSGHRTQYNCIVCRETFEKHSNFARVWNIIALHVWIHEYLSYSNWIFIEWTPARVCVCVCVQYSK